MNAVPPHLRVSAFGVRCRAPFEQLVLPGEAHDFLRYASWMAAYRAAADVFDRKL